MTCCCPTRFYIYRLQRATGSRPWVVDECFGDDRHENRTYRTWADAMIRVNTRLAIRPTRREP